MDWRHYLTDYNEGLGLVYERFVLNDFLLDMRRRHGIERVLEAPLYGMAGVSGINSVALAGAGCQVTLADDNIERLDGVKRIWGGWKLPASRVHAPDWGRLPLGDYSFGLAGEGVGRFALVGNGRPGIVRDVSHGLADAGGNVEEFHAECTGAPNSAAQLSRAQASLRLPAALPLGSLQASLEEIALDLMVDIQLATESAL